MDTSTTVLDAKAAFLRQQIRLLSQPLQPSASWRDLAPSDTDDLPDLSTKTIDAVMARVNEKLKQHNKNVYSALSQRHVAEQIDALYWNQVVEEDGEAGADALAVSRDVDLTQGEEVAQLPEELRELQIHSSAVVDGEVAAQYAVLRERLLDASRRRDEQKKRLEGYARLKKLLEPLEDVGVNVQPNLVTRDGDLSRELDRMRVLLARITGKVEAVRKKDNGRLLGEGIHDQQKLQAAINST